MPAPTIVEVIMDAQTGLDWFLKYFCSRTFLSPILDFTEGVAKGEYRNMFKLPHGMLEHNIDDSGSEDKPDGKPRNLVVIPNPHQWIDSHDVWRRFKELGDYREGTVWDLFALGAAQDSNFFRNPVLALGTRFEFGEEGGEPIERFPFIGTRHTKDGLRKVLGLIGTEPGYVGYSFLGAKQ